MFLTRGRLQYNYHKDTIGIDDISNYLENDKYQLENYISPITKEEFIKDSINYKNEYNLSNNLLKNNNSLQLPYGNVKFEKNLKRNSDSYIDYFYIGYSKALNSHIINISLYEGSQTLLLNNTKYEYKVIDSEPIFSEDKSQVINYKDSDGLSSSLTLYTVHQNSLKLNKLLWSEKNSIDYSFWNKNNEIIVKLKSLDDKSVTYAKISLQDKTTLSNKIEGIYSLKTDVFSIISDEEINLKFNFYFYNDKKMNLRISTNNVEDAYCEGIYKLIKNDNFIEGVYNDEGICTEKESDSNFQIKEENNSIYIKSKRFINQDWIKLTNGNLSKNTD